MKRRQRLLRIGIQEIMNWYRLAQSGLLSRVETLENDQHTYPIGTRRIGTEGYIDTIVEVPIESIQLESSNRIYPRVVDQYTEDPGMRLPQLSRMPGGSLTVEDGYHRILAAKNRGEVSLKAWVRDVNELFQPIQPIPR